MICRLRRTLCQVVIGGLFLQLGALAPAAEAAAEGRQFLRGMTVSCPGAGRIWGSPAMAEALDQLADLGVGWVAIHPYGWIGRDGEVRYRPAAETGYLERSVELARARGIELFWKPHLGYWGSFEWRGAIEFGEDQAAWKRFFADYREFIVDQARFAESAGVRLFAVGVELEGTTAREAEWRAILAAVRQVYSGELTYSANWDTLDEVPFWDALDTLGVQFYFPLATVDQPASESLEAAWDGPLETLRRLSRRHGGKPVVLAEIGYDLSPVAASQPWASRRQDNPANRSLRRQLMEVALARAEAEPLIQGMFWWKWMPGSRRGDFSMRDAEALDILRHAWGQQSADRGSSSSTP